MANSWINSRTKNDDLKEDSMVDEYMEGLARFETDPISDKIFISSEEVLIINKRRQRQKESMQVKQKAREYSIELEKMSTMGKSTSMKRVKKLLLQWYGPLVKALELELNEISSGVYAEDRSVSRLLIAILILLN